MNNTLLTVRDLNMKSDSFGELRHVSFRINRGKVVALFGLDGSGIELLEMVLSGIPEFFPKCGKGLYLGDRRRPKLQELQRLIKCIAIAEETMKTWSVAEYLGLKTSRALLWNPERKKMKTRAKEAFSRYGHEIDPDTTMGNLGELQLRMARILRAVEENSEILVVEDECTGMDREEIRQYGAFIRQIASEGRAVLFRCRSVELAGEICREFLVFRRGRLVKASIRGEAFKEAEISRYLLGDTYTGQLMKLGRPYGAADTDPFRQQTAPQGGMKVARSTVYQVDELVLDGKPYSFSFREGEVTCLDSASRQLSRSLFENLSGRRTDRHTVYKLDGRIVYRVDQRMLIRNRIVSSDISNGQKEIFQKLSAEDNLLMPSLTKFGTMQYFSQSSNLRKSVSEKNLSLENAAYRIRLSRAGMNDRIRLLMERWYVYNPKVLILFEPYSFCDALGVTLVSSFIRRFAEQGTAVVIIQSGGEYVQELADVIVHI